MTLKLASTLPSIGTDAGQQLAGVQRLDSLTSAVQVAQRSALKTINPNRAESEAISRFTPGYTGGGSIDVLPGFSPDGRNIGKFDATTGKVMVWSDAAQQQADQLGVNRNDYQRGIAIQEYSHSVVLTKNRFADARVMEVMGDAVTSNAYPQVGAISSLANAMTVYRPGVSLRNLPKDSYAFIYAGVERGLQTALSQAGLRMQADDSAVRILGAIMTPMIRNGASYLSALQQAASVLAQQSPGFNANLFNQIVVGHINSNVQSVASNVMGQLR
jgi:hypothetical protein